MCDFPADRHRCAMGGCHNGTRETMCAEHEYLVASPLAVAVENLRTELRRAGDVYLLPIVKWMDGQLRRWPWLYRRLG